MGKLLKFWIPYEVRVLHIGSGQLACLGVPVLNTVLRKPGLHVLWADEVPATRRTARRLVGSILGGLIRGVKERKYRSDCPVLEHFLQIVAPQ